MNENSVRQIEVQESIEISNSIDSVTSSFQRKSEDYKNKGRVVQISISFFLLFVAFNTCETLITSILEEDGLGSFGFYTLASLYFSIAINAFLSSAIVEKIGIYNSFVIGSFFHFTFVLSSILPAYKHDHPQSDSLLVSDLFIKCTLIVAALLNGFGAGIIWCALGIYIS